MATLMGGGAWLRLITLPLVLELLLLLLLLFANAVEAKKTTITPAPSRLTAVPVWAAGRLWGGLVSVAGEYCFWCMLLSLGLVYLPLTCLLVCLLVPTRYLSSSCLLETKRGVGGWRREREKGGGQ